MNTFRLLVVITMFFISGCFSTPKYYDYQGKKNLTVESELDNGVSLYLDIHEVDKECKTHSQGIINTANNPTKLSLKPNKLYYIVVMFGSHGYQSVASIRSGMLLQTYNNEQHIIKASYIDSLYDVKLFAKSIVKDFARKLNLIPLEYCSYINK